MDGETVMMDIENGKYYSLGKTGSVIWDLLEQPRSLNSICEVLSSRFAVSPETCEADVSAFLKQMLDQNLISL